MKEMVYVVLQVCWVTSALLTQMDEIGKLKQKEVIIVEHIFKSSHTMWRLVENKKYIKRSSQNFPRALSEWLLCSDSKLANFRMPYPRWHFLIIRLVTLLSPIFWRNSLRALPAWLLTLLASNNKLFAYPRWPSLHFLMIWLQRCTFDSLIFPV